MSGRLEDLAMWDVLKLLGVRHLAQCIAITAPAIFVFGCVACVMWSSHGLVPNGSQAGATCVLAKPIAKDPARRRKLPCTRVFKSQSSWDDDSQA